MSRTKILFNFSQFVRPNALNAQKPQGLSYPIDKLRQMPFTHLHSLYHVLLKERNVLETMKLNCKLNHSYFLELDNLSKVKLSMKRILHTVEEREKRALIESKGGIWEPDPIKRKALLENKSD